MEWSSSRLFNCKNQYYTDNGTLSKDFVTPNKTGLLFTYIISNYKHALEVMPGNLNGGTIGETVSVVNGIATIYMNIYRSSDMTSSVWSNTKTVTWAGQWDIQGDNNNPTGIEYIAADTKDINYVDTCMCFVNKGETYKLVVSLNQDTQIHWYDAADHRTGLNWSANGYGNSSRTLWTDNYEGNSKGWGRGSYYTYKVGIGDVLSVY